ncbi:MAG: cation:dicarboxylase symporter family transporter [Oscillibacter sp.]|nr:cation:dicarboxylase symporter family transporter [Oscillibacter sp.]
MKVDSFSESFPLTGESVDRISEQIGSFLKSLKTERANMLRVRLSLEEALLRWQDRFGQKATVSLELGMHRRRPTITLRLAGAQFNPLEHATTDPDAWSASLLSAIGLTPTYYYRQGSNVIQLKLPRPHAAPAVTLLLFAAAGLLAGTAGLALLPDHVRLAALHTVLDPIQNVFFRMLSAAAGPIVFVSVLSVICGVGSLAAMNNGGWRMLLRFLLLSGVTSIAAGAVSGVLFPTGFLLTPLDGTQFSSALDFFLQIIPGDILSPFIQGDTPQLILLALLLGDAILVAGTRTEGLSSLVGEMNAVCLLISDWVGRLSPFFMAILLVLGIWNGSGRVLLGLWKPLLLSVALTAFALALKILLVGTAAGVSPRKLLKKIRAPFLIALRTTSVNESYGANRNCCERELGIPRRLVSFGVPLGLVIYMPTATLTATVFLIYCAHVYGVQTSVIWYVTAFVLTVTLQAATPPMPGMGLLAYAAIFSRVSIPSDALTVALVADILARFFTSASDQAMLQLELVLEARRRETLNEKVLKK